MFNLFLEKVDSATDLFCVFTMFKKILSSDFLY